MHATIPASHGVILVGHGAIPTDYPRNLVVKLKALEATRRGTGGAPTAEEIDLDRHIRRWPRTAQNDPYQAGLEALGVRLQGLFNGAQFSLAYNEFCAPTLEEAVSGMVERAVTVISVVPSMLTPGGSHSEIEIPERLQVLRARHPRTEIRYAWPFELSAVAAMLAAQVTRFLP